MASTAIRTISEIEKAFLALVRLGIGHDSSASINNYNWTAIQALASQQGLDAVLIDGIDQLPLQLHPPKELLLQWIGEVLQNYEQRYIQYKRVIAEMAGFFNEHHFKMMVLKGYSCSLDWPKPEHRPCGDIDIWQFGKQKLADEFLSREKGIKVDTTEPHHTVFYWRGFMVENHYDFINIYHHKSSRQIERILKELGSDDSTFIDVYGEKVFLPSANLHSLFLLRHMVSHFASESITLRQVLDWAFFVERHGSKVEWNWLIGLLEKYQMLEFFNCINSICVEELGFTPSIFPCEICSPVIKPRVLNEILSPEFCEEQPDGLVNRNVFRFRRWKANEWKHKLCYRESMWSAFWSGVWNHLLKPKSI